MSVYASGVSRVRLEIAVSFVIIYYVSVCISPQKFPVWESAEEGCEEMEKRTAPSIEQAVALFDRHEYQAAFLAFVEVYRQDTDSETRWNALQILNEAYYDPNEAVLREKYEKNVNALKKYPWFFEKRFHKFEDLRIRLFPVSDDIYYCYDRKSQCFQSLYGPKNAHTLPYFWTAPDKPLRVEDTDNFYELTFLNDNVRASEDFAGDNHIYLLYSSLEPLERLMLSCDLEPLLEQQKFVFLIEKSTWSHYPLRFEKKFGIDYSKMKPTPVRIEEVKRFCLWYAHAYSGSIVSQAALRENSNVQMYVAWKFNTQSTVDGQSLFFSPGFQEAIRDIDRRYTPDKIEKLANSDRYCLRLEDLNEYLAWLRQQRPAPCEYTVKELFVGYCIFRYHARGLNPRIAPVLLFDPHMGNPSPYFPLILSFPYYEALTCVREPVTAFARFLTYSNLCMGWPPQKTVFWFVHDYAHGQVLHQELQARYFGIRFEDMKRKPETVCRALCKHLNIPYEERMLEADGSFTDAEGNQIKGFDAKPLHRDISGVMSEFDQMRLKMFYDPILQHYGYPRFDFEEHPLPDAVVRELFRSPFRLEYVIEKKSNGTISRETTHQWIEAAFLQLWRQKHICAQLIPLEEAGDA